MKKICRTCRKAFTTDKQDKKYCSYTCCNKYNRLKRIKEVFKLSPAELIIFNRIKEEE